MIKVRLQDGSGGGHGAKVNRDGALLVAKSKSSSIDNRLPWLSGLLLDAPTGSSGDLTVDGSSTPLLFCVRPGDTRNIFINKLVFTIHDAQMKLDSNEVRRFASAASAPGLTNGVKLIAHQDGNEFDIFSAPIQSIVDFYRFAEVQGVVGITDGISTGVDFLSMTMLFQNPLGLKAGTTDSISVSIEDDLTSLDLFEVYYSGHYEDD